MEISILKKAYGTYVKKYNLPAFEDLNENFEIDKIDRESDFFLRVVRKAIMDKIVNSIGFLEMLLSQQNIPRMYFMFLRTINNEDRVMIEKMYSSLSELSLLSLELEINYSEKGEASLIKKCNEVWNSLKKDFSRLISRIRNPSVNNIKKEKSYFG